MIPGNMIGHWFHSDLISFRIADGWDFVFDEKGSKICSEICGVKMTLMMKSKEEIKESQRVRIENYNRLNRGVKPMKKLYIEATAVLLMMTFIIIAAFKVPQSNYYLTAICILTIGLAVWGISLGITMAEKFGDKHD